MDKRKKNIIIWMLTWASLLVAVLYSPLGSPELYNERNTITYQGVNFSNRDIANAPKFNRSAGNNAGGISIPTNNFQPTGNSTYKVSGSTPTNNSGSYTGRQTEDNYTSNQLSQSGDMNIGLIGGVKSVDKATGGITGNHFLSLNSDLSAVNNTPLQGTTQDGTMIPTTDPGGDSTGNPIPVGDGWGFLILLSIIYFVVRKFIFTAK